MPSNSDEPLYIVYDGDCPLCSQYVQMMRLKQSTGMVHLVNARAPDEFGHIVARIIKCGYNLDEGMAMMQGQHIAHGHDCLNHLALLSTRSNAFNWINARLFASPRRAKALYPALRMGRNALLKLLGRSNLGGRPG